MSQSAVEAVIALVTDAFVARSRAAGGKKLELFGMIGDLHNSDLPFQIQEAWRGFLDWDALGAELRREPSADRRAKLVLAILLSFPQRATAALVAALHDPEPPVRWIAAKALTLCDGEEVENALLAALEDPDDGVRFYAAVSLYRKRPDNAMEYLLGRLEKEAGTERAETARALSALTGKRFLLGQTDPAKWRKWWSTHKQPGVPAG